MTRAMAARSASTLAFFRSRMPAPACTTRAALSGWSRPRGTRISGTLGDQRLHHGAVPAVGDDRRAVREHIGVAYPPGDGDVPRGGDHGRVYCRAGGDQPAHLELAERVGGPLQQCFLAA